MTAEILKHGVRLAAKAEALQRCLARIRATCPAAAEALARALLRPDTPPP